MTTNLSIGRWRGLKTCSTDVDTFAILAFDQRGSYRKMLPDNASFEMASQIKSQVVRAIVPHATAVLLDSVYGLESAIHMSGHRGILMAIEKTGYSGEATARRIDFIEGWDIAKIKQMGASAVKMLAYYHPDAGEASEHIEETVRQIADEAHKYDLPLFLEPVTYSPDVNVAKDSPEFAKQRPTIIRETIGKLQTCGADVLKVEFPVDAAFDDNLDSWKRECDAIDAIATVPWAILSAGVDFSTFEKQVRVACQAGSSGFLGGRAIWKESIGMSDDERKSFLATTAVERMKTLKQLVEEFGKPWTEYYSPMPANDGWYHHYMAE